jgi:hypothetical protein
MAYGAELPFDDPSLAELATIQRVAIAAHWKRRMRSELMVGLTFEAMLPILRERNAAVAVLDMLARSADEERRHSEICARLAEVYGDESVERLTMDSVTLPRFNAGDDDLETTLLVAGMCCVNETVATAWISACLAAAESPLAKMANRIHLTDEIEHARLGWAHLASDAVGDETRRQLATCLPRLFEANAPSWEHVEPAMPLEGVPAQGQLPAAVSRAVYMTAIAELVIPGFAHVGVDVEPANAWLARRAQGVSAKQ